MTIGFFMCGRRESNPQLNIGNVVLCHLTTPAKQLLRHSSDSSSVTTLLRNCSRLCGEYSIAVIRILSVIVIYIPATKFSNRFLLSQSATFGHIHVGTNQQVFNLRFYQSDHLWTELYSRKDLNPHS